VLKLRLRHHGLTLRRHLGKLKLLLLRLGVGAVEGELTPKSRAADEGCPESPGHYPCPPFP
jgi:hypothetical protein